ncbi:MAG: HAMP domain-containing protein [Caldilineaceae bacterium]|nr:HAMP domain-containing protein [Caldilineaceae bacterium]
MQRLWVKLMGAFAAIIVVGIVVTVLLAWQGTVTQVSHIAVGNRMVQPSVLRQNLIDFYASQRSWEGLERRLAQLVVGSAGHGMMHGMMGNGQMMRMFDGTVLVLDAAGQPIASLGDLSNLSPSLRSGQDGWPLLLDGERIGMLIVEGTPITGLDSDSLVSAVTRAVLTAALVAAAVAFVLGAVLIRQITRPLAQLNSAAKEIAVGDLNVRVNVASRDEVGQLGETFNGMVASLATQESLRRNLMADIAHELRTPLTGIQGTVEAMQDGIFPMSAEPLESIHEGVMLLNRLVEDLRTLAHAEAGQLSLHKERVDPAALAARARTAQLPQAQQRNIALSLSVADALPTIWGDEERLQQVLGNLLANALRHTPSGGAVDLNLSAANGQVDIAVVDSGEGIDPADLPYVFNRFYRGDPSRSRSTGGSGLGLAIVRQLVEAHGGHVRVESPPAGRAHGTAVHVQLPVTQAHPRIS